MRTLLVLSIALASLNASAQTGSPDDAERLGPGITPPQIMSKVEPEYTAQARAALVQGTAVFDITIGTDGRVVSITLVSPIGFGLDERAEQAMEALEVQARGEGWEAGPLARHRGGELPLPRDLV